MSFATNVLAKLQEQPILQEADSVRFHKIGNEVFEVSIDGQSLLFTTDAGLDFLYSFAEFLSSMESPKA